MRLAIVLRFLAGGETVDLATIYHVTRKEVYNTIWRGVDAINKELEMPEDLWDDPVKLGVMEAQFRSKSRAPSWVGQVGAVDGCHFKTKNPGVKVPNPRDYFVARKAEYALLATAVCDNDRRFTYWDISCTPTTHDSTAWAQCSLGIRVAERGLPGPFFSTATAPIRPASTWSDPSTRRRTRTSTGCRAATAWPSSARSAF